MANQPHLLVHLDERLVGEVGDPGTLEDLPVLVEDLYSVSGVALYRTHG